MSAVSPPLHHASFRDTLIDLRLNILRRLSWVILIAFSVVGYAALIAQEFRPDVLTLALIGMMGVLLLRRLIARWLDGARFGLIVLLHGALFAAYAFTRAEWLPFFGAVLVLVTGMISSRLHWASAGAVLAGAAALGAGGDRLAALALVLGVTGAVMQVSVNTLYTAITWYSAMQEHADRLLEQTRQRQAELAGTVKSLEIAYQNVRRLGTQLAAAQRQADEARRMKERFAANISHELRTPLNLILGFSEIMTLTPEVYGIGRFPPKLARDVYQLYSSSRHLLALIDDVLDLSQIELSSFALHLQRTDLSEFMRETGAMCANLFRDGKLTFTLDIPDDLPTIEIDRTRIRQVLLNLLSNAHRFTERGEVCVAVRPHAGGVAFSVRDTGRGIPADKLALVFDEFYQVDYSLSRGHGGAGLGLAICKQFVERHGGTIGVESAEGVGSTFTFWLPARITQHDDAPTRDAPSNAPRALIIDRDPLLGALVRRAIAPCEVVQVADASAIEEAIDLHQPALIIANHPNGEGDPPAIPPSVALPIIRCALPSAGAMLSTLDVQGYLPKPFSTAQLAEMLRMIGGTNGVRRVLIVDDDLGFVSLVARGLESIRADLMLHTAHDGMAALKQAREHPPDLVLLDLVMPGMDGFALIDAIRSLPRMHDLPIVLITATSRQRDAADAFGTLTLERAGGLRPGDALAALRGLARALVTG
jgi:signal transduction histidine kinase/CheY-like chemotaxis protein